MKSRRLGIVALSFMAMLYALAPAWAEEVHVVQSTPAASAVIGGRSTEFFVRFDRPRESLPALVLLDRSGRRSLSLRQLSAIREHRVRQP
jgi:hypothetical protein